MFNTLSFKNKLQNLVHQPTNHTYLLAVSGGVDSMVLAYCFQDLGLRFQVAHVNYKLRGEDSDLDQKVVEDFCKKNQIKFHVYEVSKKDKKPENSIQLWARELRYTFFRALQEKEKLGFLVTAHHLNDQLETFIINLSKAAGIKGLSGIPANENSILRPLLNFSKEQIYEFAREKSIEFREDISNKNSDYLRNKIRNDIVPKLLDTNNCFLENFKKSVSYINQTKNFVQNQIQEIENKLSVFSKDHTILSKENLNLESDFVKFEILKKYGFNQKEEILKIFKAENRRSFFSKEYQLIIDREELIFSKLNLSDVLKKKYEEIILMINEDQEVIFPEGLEFQISTTESLEWLLDIESIRFPLKLRKKKEGDVFFPIGMKGKKKVSKFLRDEKLSILEKENVWVLCDSKGQILGILPYRQDGRWSAGSHTKKILKIKWTEKQRIL